jgi:AraC-like DNA-binding protein
VLNEWLLDWPDADALPGVLLGRLEVRVLLAAVNKINPDNWSLQLGTTHWRLYQHDAPGSYLESEASDMGGSLRWELLPHRVYLIPSGCALRSCCTQPLRHFYLQFDLPGFAVQSVQRELFPGPVMVPHSASFEASVMQLADVVADVAGAERGISYFNPARECWMRGVICEALGRYLSSLPMEDLTRYHERLLELKPFFPALAHINAHLEQSLCNQNLATLCNMSEDYFIRRFRIAVGVTPARYIVQRRIARATELLLTTNWGLERIAETTGFCDRHYFTRTFTRATGRTPAAFRRDERPAPVGEVA